MKLLVNRRPGGLLEMSMKVKKYLLSLSFLVIAGIITLHFFSKEIELHSMQIDYKKFTLSNGLRFIVHEDHSTPMAVLNVLYDVGARDENPDKTGFAHLFEHLMFGGSVNIKDFEGPLLMAGGENNAFTTNDLTNYYIQLPAENIETACWLESDRMISLAFSEKSLDVQRKVVCEELKNTISTGPMEMSRLN
ncbi:MAG: insulinase family protein [Puia sp.]